MLKSIVPHHTEKINIQGGRNTNYPDLTMAHDIQVLNFKYTIGVCQLEIKKEILLKESTIRFKLRSVLILKVKANYHITISFSARLGPFTSPLRRDWQ